MKVLYLLIRIKTTTDTVIDFSYHIRTKNNLVTQCNLRTGKFADSQKYNINYENGYGQLVYRNSNFPFTLAFGLATSDCV